MRLVRHVLAAAILGAAATGAVAADRFAVDLRPVAGADGVVARMEVRETVDRDAAAAPFMLSAPVSMPGIPHLADGIAGLVVSDEAGAATMTATDVAGPGEFGPARQWRASRPLGRHIVARYDVAPVAPRQGGPPYALKAAGDGVAGGTNGVILVPAALASRRTMLRWDLSSLPPGAVGVTSEGRGTVAVEGPPSAAADRWLLAGSALALHDAPQPGFNAYALGQPPFDVRAMMVWAERSYAVLAKAYGYLGVPRYQLLFRAVPGPIFATGTASSHSALVTTGTAYHAGQDIDWLHETVFHEMTHQWTGQSTPEESWFAEGLTVFVTATLPCEARLLPAANCAKMIDKRMHDLYTSRALTWSDAQISAAPFADEAVRQVPYNRGMLYFAEVDAAIRARSGGRRDLIDALRPLFAAREKGTPLTRAGWEGFVRRELGEKAVGQFEQTIVAGTRVPMPPSDAFGPCLHRVDARWTDGGRTVSGVTWAVRPDAGAACTATVP